MRITTQTEYAVRAMVHLVGLDNPRVRRGPGRVRGSLRPDHQGLQRPEQLQPGVHLAEDQHPCRGRLQPGDPARRLEGHEQTVCATGHLVTTMAQRRWTEGDWIDFIVRFGVPTFCVVWGALTLWALVVLVKAALAGG